LARLPCLYQMQWEIPWQLFYRFLRRTILFQFLVGWMFWFALNSGHSINNKSA
jgi:hypothetical protein